MSHTPVLIFQCSESSSLFELAEQNTVSFLAESVQRAQWVTGNDLGIVSYSLHFFTVISECCKKIPRTTNTWSRTFMYVCESALPYLSKARYLLYLRFYWCNYENVQPPRNSSRLSSITFIFAPHSVFLFCKIWVLISMKVFDMMSHEVWDIPKTQSYCFSILVKCDTLLCVGTFSEDSSWRAEELDALREKGSLVWGTHF